MFRLVKRSTSNFDKPPVILKTSSSSPFRKICTDSVSSIYDLLAHSGLGKVIPLYNDSPNSVRELFGKLIDSQFFKVGLSHKCSVRWGIQSTKYKAQRSIVSSLLRP